MMDGTDLETLFLRFREESDTDALAVVFERVAPGLLRTATSLCGSAVAGEDLLQACFVTAIERRARWDASRPLVPWLVGILTRHARELRRRRSRRLDPERVAGTDAAEPDAPCDAAEAEELQLALEAGLAELPEPVRQVVVLALRHELAPAEIAEALGRSPSTVRTQLQRGLARLRRRLPRSLAPLAGLVAAVGSAEPRGLPAVRDAVLRHARRVLPVPVSSPVSLLANPGAVMLNVLACSLVFLGAVALRPLPAREASPPAVPVALQRVPSNDPVRSGASGAPVGANAARSEVASLPASQVDLPAEQEEAAILTLRIAVRDPGGAPVAGARVALEGVRLLEEPGSLYGWRAGVVAPRLTDGEGRAELVLPAVWEGKHPDAVHFTVDHRDFAPFRSALVELAGGRAEVALEWGARLAVSGWIAGPDGLRREVRDVRPELGERSNVDSGDWTRREDGLLETAGLAPGAHQLAVWWTAPDGARYASAIEPVTLEPGGSRAASLELLPLARVVGRLAADVPRPVTGGEVVAHQSGGTEEAEGRMLARTWRAPVAADGTFVLEDVAPGAAELGVLVDGWTSLGAGTTGNPTADVAGSDLDLAVPMVRTAAVDARVTGPDGAPVAGVWLSAVVPVRWSDGRWQYFESTPSAETDAAGRGLLENVPPGMPRLGAFHRELRIDGPHPLTSETTLPDGPLEPGELRTLALELVARTAR